MYVLARLRFGPAGKPIDYTGPTQAIPAYLNSKGLDAFEYQAVRNVRVREEVATQLRLQAEKYDVLLSMHGPYYINLSSDKMEVIEKSIKWLVLAAITAYKMGANIVVFHPGYYGNKSPREALELAVNSLKRIVEELSSNSIKSVSLGAETTGRISQLGSLEEVIELCLRVDMVKPVIDWAHLHARTLGEYINSVEDVTKTIDLLEREIGKEAVENLHMHYSKIEYGKGGEREHHVLEDTNHGPDYLVVCRGLREVGISGVLISETPLLDRDAILMRDVYAKECKEVSTSASKV